MVYADAAALTFPYAEGQLLRLVLPCVYTFGQGVAFFVGQGIANRVASANHSRIIILLHGKHNVPKPDVRYCAKSYEE
jgi:hypothetical protein